MRECLNGMKDFHAYTLHLRIWIVNVWGINKLNWSFAILLFENMSNSGDLRALPSWPSDFDKGNFF